MKRLFLVPALGMAALSAAAPAHAQLNGWLDQSRQAYTEAQPYYESRRGAYDNGYREGVKEGEKDGRSRDPFHYQDEGAFRNGDKGYHRSYGDRERYRQSFRAGFADGYGDGYNRLAPRYGYGNGNGNGRPGPRYEPGYGYPSTYPNRNGYPGGYGYGGYRSPAFANGANDGYEKGREDARDRDAYDPRRHKWYRDGDHDYRNEYGPRQTYEDTYRRGFLEGYDRAYREWSYRR
jgi:hypothetical protein